MNNELQNIGQQNEADLLLNQSKIFFESGIFVDVKSAAQAYVKVMAGREIGLSPIASMNSIYIVNNKVGYETKIFLAKLKAAGKYNYKIIKNDEQECVIEFSEKVFEALEILGQSSFTFKEAAKIGLANSTAYKNYPALMLFYRAASLGIKKFCPDVLDGRQIYEDMLELEKKKKTLQIDLQNKEIKEVEGGDNDKETK